MLAFEVLYKENVEFNGLIGTQMTRKFQRKYDLLNFSEEMISYNSRQFEFTFVNETNRQTQNEEKGVMYDHRR